MIQLDTHNYSDTDCAFAFALVSSTCFALGLAKVTICNACCCRLRGEGWFPDGLLNFQQHGIILKVAQILQNARKMNTLESFSLKIQLRLNISMVLNASSIFIMGFSKYFETLCIQLSKLSQRILVDNFWESSSAFSDKFTVCTKNFLVLWGWWTLNYAEYHQIKKEKGLSQWHRARDIRKLLSGVYRKESEKKSSSFVLA